ncbi:MAG: SoxR reducing system RseC family protein [Candidatus Neomarinimicrobiota bacterium]
MSNKDQYFKSDCETATVTAVEGRWVVIELEQQDGCHECGAKMICRPNASGKRVLKIPNTLSARVGEQVQIEQIGRNQLKLTMIQYGLPLFGFLAGILIASHYIRQRVFGVPAEIAQFFCGVVVIILIGFGINIWSKRQAQKDFSVFRLRQIISNEKL